VEARQALAELMELSSQVERAIVLRADGSVLASTTDDPAAGAALARSALELVATAFELRSTREEVTRVEVELAGGGVFVLRDGGRTIAATTAPGATPGLVVYDLRTCLHAIDDGKPKRQRKAKEPEEPRPEEPAEPGEPAE
jgi:predicted regulator of Ras-like GTPase activity (Roadblock/LC7/MglB family)